MHTFAQKQKATQNTTSAKTTLPARARFGHSREVKGILHLQRTIGNQAVQRIVQCDTEELEAGSATTASVRFAHDFSQIPLHAKAHTNCLSTQCNISAYIHRMAACGVKGAGEPLPFLRQIQRGFGRHDVTGVKAHVDGRASKAARTISAKAYAMGNDVAFDGAPDLHTAAHEAAHVIQQRAGVQLKGGFGQVGDPYELHADAVANCVGNGGNAEALLNRVTGQSTTDSAPVIQRNQSEWHKDRQDWRFNWCMNNPDSQHQNDIPACRQEVEKWTGQPYHVPHYDEDNFKPDVITPGKDNDTTADDSDNGNVLNEGGNCSTKQAGGRTVTAPDSKQIPIPNSLRVSPDASINVTGTFPNYDVVAINPASMSNDTKGILKAFGVGVLGGGVKKLLTKKGLGKIAAWAVSRPAAIVGSVVFSLFDPVSIAKEDHVRTKYCDGMNVKYTIIGGD